MAPPGPPAAVPWRHWWQRFRWGFLQPFHLLRRLRAEPVAFRAYLRTVVVQGALVLAAGSAYFVYHLPAVREEAEPVVEARGELKAARKAAAAARVELDRAQKALDAAGTGAPAETARERQRREAAEARSRAKAERRVAQLARQAERAPGDGELQAALAEARAALEAEGLLPAAGAPPAPEGVPAAPVAMAAPVPGEPPVPPPPPGVPTAEGIQARVRAALEKAGATPQAKAALEQAKAVLAEAQASPEAGAAVEEARAALEELKATQPEAAAAVERARAAVEQARAAPGTRALEEAASSALARAQAALPAEARAGLAAALADLAAPGSREGAQERVAAATEALQDAKEAEADAAEKLKEVEAEASLTWWRWLGAWVSSLVLAQWVVLALSRDYQDRLARDLSLVAGLQPEDLPGVARVRLDLGWLRRKMRRKLRGAMAVGVGVGMLSPLLLVGTVVGLRHEATSVVVGVVSAYWWVVFSAARSARAWRFEADPTPPRPLKALLQAGEAVPAARGVVRWLAAPLARRFTGSLWAPAREVEQDFPAFAGLAVARLLATLPVVRIVLRAPLVVAAGEAIEASVPVTLGPAPAAEAVAPVAPVLEARPREGAEGGRELALPAAPAPVRRLQD